MIRRATRLLRALLYALRPDVAFTTGQPVFETRPHAVKAGDLTPGILAMEYFERRLRLAAQMPPKSVAIITGSSTKYASGLVFYEFQQNNDLYYLSGWLEPDSVIAIENTAAGETEFHMVVPAKHEWRDMWEGAKLGLEGAHDIFNADHVVDSAHGASHLKDLAARASQVFVDTTKPDLATAGLNSTINQIAGRPGVKLVAPLVAQLRAVKLPAELRVMKAAGKALLRAINATIGLALAGRVRQEKVLGKMLDYQFVLHGCDRQAYVPVVALGLNALTIHYTRNDDIMYDDELVFIDAGGKLGGYCADISRAWPNSGRFSQPQRDLYQVVLDTNKQCIDLCLEGTLMHDIHDKLVTFLWRGLRQLPGWEDVSKTDVGRTLYPHYIGHHLGLDLHDVPSVLRFEPLKRNNVVTIEPGLYIPRDAKWPKAFQGIGIRVEDDVVVGSSPATITNLTAGCVKEVVDIESLAEHGATTPEVGVEVVETEL